MATDGRSEPSGAAGGKPSKGLLDGISYATLITLMGYLVSSQETALFTGSPSSQGSHPDLATLLGEIANRIYGYFVDNLFKAAPSNVSSALREHSSTLWLIATVGLVIAALVVLFSSKRARAAGTRLGMVLVGGACLVLLVRMAVLDYPAFAVRNLADLNHSYGTASEDRMWHIFVCSRFSDLALPRYPTSAVKTATCDVETNASARRAYQGLKAVYAWSTLLILACLVAGTVYLVWRGNSVAAKVGRAFILSCAAVAMVAHAHWAGRYAPRTDFPLVSVRIGTGTMEGYVIGRVGTTGKNGVDTVPLLSRIKDVCAGDGPIPAHRDKWEVRLTTGNVQSSGSGDAITSILQSEACPRAPRKP